MKKSLRILSLLLALMLALFAFAACGADETVADTGSGIVSTETENPATEAKITVTVQVVDDKGETQDFVIETAEKYLRGALEQEKLVEGEESSYGLYIKKVNGILADYDANGAYWSVYEGENMAMTGVDGIELKNGGVYKLVYTKG